MTFSGMQALELLPSCDVPMTRIMPLTVCLCNMGEAGP
jgi:hypothetical protein